MFHSKQWHYSLHKDFQKLHSTHSTWRSPRDSSNSTFYIRVPIQNSKSRTPSRTPYRRQRALHPVQNPILHTEGKEIFEYIHSSYKTFQRHSRHSSHKTFQGHSRYSRYSRHSWYSAFQALLHIPVLPVPSSASRVPPHYSILQLECIFYIFYTLTGFHRNSTEYQLRHSKHSTDFHSSKKGRCCDIGQNM